MTISEVVDSAKQQSAVDDSGRWTGDSAGNIGLTPRELRLVVERNLLVLGFQQSESAPVRDMMLEAQALGLPMLEVLDSDFDSLGVQEMPRLRISREVGARAWVDGGGLLSLFLAPSVIDLGVALSSHHGWAAITIANVSHPEMMTAVTASVWRYGLAAVITVGGETSASRHTGDTIDMTGEVSVVFARNSHQVGPEGRAALAGGEAMLRAAVEQMPARADTYWRVYDRALLALAEDTDASSRHAGPTMIDAEGRVHGEPLEEL